MILKATQICKKFTHPLEIDLLKEISLEIKAGESVAITGKSGEGKSTLLHILGTLEKPSSGALEICGHDTRTASLAQLRSRSIGFIFQAGHLLEEDTVLDNVLMPAKIARMPTDKGSASHRRALELIEQVGLKERALFPAKLLSGGEKQRACIARALCNSPELILADEPSGNLDHANSQEIHQLLIQLTKEMHKALIVVTHDKEFALLCDRVLLLKSGQLL